MADEGNQGADAGAPSAASTARIVVERPPPGLARGKYEWPAWAIGTVGGVVVAVAIAFIAWRLWRARRV